MLNPLDPLHQNFCDRHSAIDWCFFFSFFSLSVVYLFVISNVLDIADVPISAVIVIVYSTTETGTRYFFNKLFKLLFTSESLECT